VVTNPNTDYDRALARMMVGVAIALVILLVSLEGLILYVASTYLGEASRDSFHYRANILNSDR
jgi:hypothetical protein